MRQPSFRGLIAAFGDVGGAWVVAYHVMQNRTITTATIDFEIRLRAAAARSSRNKSVTVAFNASGTASTTNTNRLTPDERSHMFAKSLSDWLQQQRGMRVNLTGAYCCLNPICSPEATNDHSEQAWPKICLFASVIGSERCASGAAGLGPSWLSEWGLIEVFWRTLSAGSETCQF